jgi:hypothetical protein
VLVPVALWHFGTSIPVPNSPCPRLPSPHAARHSAALRRQSAALAVGLRTTAAWPGSARTGLAQRKVQGAGLYLYLLYGLSGSNMPLMPRPTLPLLCCLRLCRQFGQVQRAAVRQGRPGDVLQVQDCSAECLRVHWRVHKAECKVLSAAATPAAAAATAAAAPAPAPPTPAPPKALSGLDTRVTDFHCALPT